MKEGAVRPFKVNEKLFSNRPYKLEALPKELEGYSFILSAIDGDKKLRCTKAGVVYVLTPTAARNARCSQTKILLKQGFKKVALPEIPLFPAGRHGGTTRFLPPPVPYTTSSKSTLGVLSRHKAVPLPLDRHNWSYGRLTGTIGSVFRLSDGFNMGKT